MKACLAYPALRRGGERISEQQLTLRRGTILLTGVGIASQAMGFFYRVLLSRLVGAETLGLYQLVMPVYAVLLSVTVSGLAVAVSTLSARYEAQGGRRASLALLSAGIRCLLCLWLFCAVVVTLCADWLAGAVLGDSRTKPALLLLLPVLLLTGVENLTKHHFYGTGESTLPAGIELAEQFVRTSAILLLLKRFLPLSQGDAVALLVLGMLVSEVFSSSTLTFFRSERQKNCKADANCKEQRFFQTCYRDLASVAVPVGFSALLNNLIGSANAVLLPRQLQRFGMSYTSTMELYGVVFGMTLPLLTLCYAFVNALCISLLPVLTRCMALHERTEFNGIAWRAMQATACIAYPIICLSVPLGDDIGRFLFQEQRAGLFLLPLAIAVALSVQESVLATVLNGAGQQGASAAVSFLCGGIQLFFTCFGVERFGMSAFVMGMVVSSVAGVVFRLCIGSHTTGLCVPLVQCFVTPALCAITSALWVNLLHRGFFHPLRVGVLGCGMIGGMLYGVLLLLLTSTRSMLERSSCNHSKQRKRI